MNGSILDWVPASVRQQPGVTSDPESLLDLLLRAVEEQAALLARDIDQVYDDFFVESCAEWAVPYIGSLLGLPSDATRLEVANTIALRRRKGTPAALEDFAEVVSGWVARAVEGWQITASVHRLGHPRGPRPTVFDFRDLSKRRVGGAFDRSQRVASHEQRVAPNGVRVTVWPWTVHTHHDTEAAPAATPSRYMLHPLGAESPMYLRPRPLAVSRTPGEGRTTDESDAPTQVTYRVLQALAREGDITVGGNWTIAQTHALADTDPSSTPALLRLSAIDTATGARALVPWTALRFGSLPSGSAAPHPPLAAEVVVDIARGSVELGQGWAAPVRATWHRAVTGEAGALPGQGATDSRARVVVSVNPDAPPGPTVRPTITQAISQAELLSSGLDPADSRPGIPDVEIRLATSSRLTAPNAPVLTFTPTLPRWRIVAPALMTPTVAGSLTVDLAGACVSLEGFQLTRDLRIGPSVQGVELTNITMDPVAGSTLAIDPSAWGLELAIDRCMLGPVRAELAARPIRITNSIVDGAGEALRTCGPAVVPPRQAAVAAAVAFAPMVESGGVTFNGFADLDSIEATDCIFVDGLQVAQTQMGCVRFSYIAASAPSDLPVKYLCVDAPAPSFQSNGFESAEYLALRLDGQPALLTASSSGGEIGAYAHVGSASRYARIRRRAGEFVPLGVRSGVIVAREEEE